MARYSHAWNLTVEQLTSLLNDAQSYTQLAALCKSRYGVSVPASTLKKIVHIRIPDYRSFEERSQLLQNIARSRALTKSVDERATSQRFHYNMRKAIIAEGRIPYVCDICENPGLHNGQALTLQLDHIDGNRKNNAVVNLRFLCPNCHSQTPTWGSLNRRSTPQ
jgi:hypothetical protein